MLLQDYNFDGTAAVAGLSFPKRNSNKKTRASRFSLEFNGRSREAACCPIVAVSIEQKCAILNRQGFDRSGKIL
jgi:hypothetical protein